MSDLSLLAIMRNDPDYAKQLAKRIEEVRQDKKNLLSAADKIAQEHVAEIEEGTRRKALLLSEGERRGLDEEEVMKTYGRFLPTRHTPILNLLYFLLKEDTSKMWKEELREEFFRKFGYEYDGLNENQLDEKYGREEHTEPVDENVEDPPSMETFIYGEMSHAVFQKIKKLKTLSLSENEHEAFLAYRICMKLCEKYGLDFSKIPCYTDKKK
jgi:hypothetical protein